MMWHFTTMRHAEAFSYFLTSMTGDQTRILCYCYGQWRVERFTGTRWVNA